MKEMVLRFVTFLQMLLLGLGSCPVVGRTVSGSVASMAAARSTLALQAPAAITWTQLVNCQVSGGVLRKTSVCDGCPDASAVSSQSLAAGDGYVQVSVDSTATDRYCGLSHLGNNPRYSTLDFALHLGPTGVLEVREDNLYRTDVRYRVGDVLMVSVESGAVKYYQNGTVFYKSGKTPVYPLVADASLLSANATVANAAGVLASPPTITGVVGSNITSSSITLSWMTSAPSDTEIESGLTSAYGTISVLGTALVTSHSGTLNGLTPGTTYHYRARSQDQSGTVAVSGDNTFSTLAAQPSSTLAVTWQMYSNLRTTGATILWTTNQPGDSQVEYGTTQAYGSKTPIDPKMDTSHSIFLCGLQPGLAYNYRVVTHDSRGDVAVSNNLTLTTPAQAGPGDAALPAVSVDTSMPPTGTGVVHPVNSGGDLQGALNSAQPGDTIVLQAGATFVAPAGGFVLPPKNNPSQSWILMTTSDLNDLPPAGGHVGPANAPAMPKILSGSTWPALMTQTGSGAGAVAYWRIVGVEVSVTASALADANVSGANANNGLIRLGDAYETSLQNVPHHLVMDRCYIHGGPTVNTIRGIALNSAYTGIIDSYLSDFHGVGWESQAIAGWNGPGPYKIVDNYLEGASENIMFGGGDPQISGLIPSDIEIRRNHFRKPLSWQAGSTSYAGYHWNVKNVFELKNSSRVLIQGNLFENSWVDGQVGYAISIKSSNQDGTAPWSQTRDVLLVDNRVRNAAIGIQVAARDNTSTVQVTTRIWIACNVFENINSAASGGSGTLVRIIGQSAPVGYTSSAPTYVTVDHNTGFVSSNVYGKMVEVDDVTPNFVFTNNLFDMASYAVKGDGTADGAQTLSTYFPGTVFVKNGIVGNSAESLNFSGYPGNYFPNSWTDVGFVNYNGGIGGDYHLVSSSPYKNSGTDGSDLGAGADAISAATGTIP